MVDTHILYSYRRCPYAIRARFALYKAGISTEIREISLRDKPREMIAISPKGTVPVLQTTDGQIIDESLDIMYWALNQSDPDDWLQSYNDEGISNLVSSNDNQFKPLLDQYKYFDRHGLTKEAAREKTAIWLEQIETRLGESQYLVSDRFSLADAALFPFLRQYRGVDTEWFDHSEFARIKAWLYEIFESESFTAIMQKKAVWLSGDAE